MAKKHEQKQKIDYPNDKFFKEVMSQRDAALSYLYAFLPQDLREHLLFETLELSKDSYVTPELETFFSDIVYT